MNFTLDDVYVKLSVTNQLSKICNIHLEKLFSVYLKLTLSTYCQKKESNIHISPILILLEVLSMVS